MLEVGSAKSWVLVLNLGLLLLVCQTKSFVKSRNQFINAVEDDVGLMGPYCATRYRERVCCAGRQDDCSVPILGTLCYCDDFCRNRTRDEDCCPDYASFCRGEVSESFTNRDCVHNGKTYYFGNKFYDNCNKCTCGVMDGSEKSEIICETNTCLMDKEIVEVINSYKDFFWRATNYSEFWGHTLSDGLKKRLGTLNPSKSVYRMNAVRRIYKPDELPKRFDSRDKWGGDITPVHDQGWCGSSWAISTVDVASDRFAIMSNGTEKVQLSSQHLISCNSRGQLGCRGGYLDRAWLFMRKFGLTDQECYPWTGKSDKCKILRKGKLSDSGCRKRNSFSLRNELYKVGPAYRLGNETDIMHEIMTSGPVQATMRVYQDFFHYQGGIYWHPRDFTELPNSASPESGYHSVRIVGWDELKAPLSNIPIKYWIVANSWGEEWGNDGYFNIIRGENECEIESFVLGVWAKTL